MGAPESATTRYSDQPWPLEIRLKQREKRVEVDFDTGETFSFSAEFLRVESPSAAVQGHRAEEKQTVPGRKHVGILAIEPVGNYAVRIRFDDLHETGLYSWNYLYKLGRNQDSIWQDYLNKLAEKGLSREP